MIKTILYALLIAFIIVFVALVRGFLLVKTMTAILDYFDEEEETETYEESSTTTLPPAMKEWINEEPLQAPPYKPLSTEEKIRNLESEIIRIWDYILKIR